MKLLPILIIFVVLFFFAIPHAFASTPTPLHGYDISFPQCGKAFPEEQYDFGIVGVNNGKAFTINPCLQTEFIWAKRASTSPDLYINLNYPAGSTDIFAHSGPLGSCKSRDQHCLAYNYGYNAAKFSYEYANSQLLSSKMWWVDIETANTWADDFKDNTFVLNGAIDYLTTIDKQVGIYSTHHEWSNIMPYDYIPTQKLLSTVPNWIGGADEDSAPFFCYRPFIPGSLVYISQYVDGEFDNDILCQ